MKGKDLAVLGLLGLGAYLLYKKIGVGGGGGGGGGIGYTVYNIAPAPQPLSSVTVPVPINYVDRPMLEDKGYITPSTPTTYNEQILNAPPETVRSGTAPQNRPDQWWSQGTQQPVSPPSGSVGAGAGVRNGNGSKPGGGGAGTR